MKKTLFILFYLTLGCVSILFAQDAKKEVETIKTKMDAFSSKTGTITKFIDTKLPDLKTTYSSPETRIRKISNTNTSAYFYQIEKEGKYSNITASIEYSDLLEVIKALSVLKVEESKDIASNPDYLENKFVTVDGFQIGYFVNNGKSTWYIKLEKYGSDNTVFINDVNVVETAFTEAKNKIEKLKQ
ncbi:hypothetical protein [Dysgonomonas reticulitermitis]